MLRLHNGYANSSRTAQATNQLPHHCSSNVNGSRTRWDVATHSSTASPSILHIGTTQLALLAVGVMQRTHRPPSILHRPAGLNSRWDQLQPPARFERQQPSARIDSQRPSANPDSTASAIRNASDPARESTASGHSSPAHSPIQTPAASAIQTPAHKSTASGPALNPIQLPAASAIRTPASQRSEPHR